MLTPDWFEQISDRLRFAEIRLLPSWWFSTGLVEAMRRPVIGDRFPWSESVMFLVLLISNALFFYQVAVWLSGWVYRSSFSRMQTERIARRRPSTRPSMDRLAAGDGCEACPRRCGCYWSRICGSFAATRCSGRSF